MKRRTKAQQRVETKIRFIMVVAALLIIWITFKT